MKKKLLTKQILMALAMSAVVCTNGMAEELGQITGSYNNDGKPFTEDVTFENTDPKKASIEPENGAVNIHIKTEEEHSITLDSAGSGIHAQNGAGTIELNSSANNTISFGGEGNGITTKNSDSEKISIALKAAQDNVIDAKGETMEAGQDGIHLEGKGQTEITLDAGGNNKWLCHNKQLINSHFYRGVSELPYKLLFAVIYTHLEFRYEVSHTITSHHVHHFHQTRIPDGTLLDYMVQYRKPLFPQFFLYPKKFLPENNPHHKEFHLRPYIQNNANQ